MNKICKYIHFIKPFFRDDIELVTDESLKTLLINLQNNELDDLALIDLFQDIVKQSIKYPSQLMLRRFRYSKFFQAFELIEIFPHFSSELKLDILNQFNQIKHISAVKNIMKTILTNAELSLIDTPNNLYTILKQVISHQDALGLMQLLDSLQHRNILNEYLFTCLFNINDPTLLFNNLCLLFKNISYKELSQQKYFHLVFNKHLQNEQYLIFKSLDKLGFLNQENIPLLFKILHHKNLKGLLKQFEHKTLLDIQAIHHLIHQSELEYFDRNYENSF
jgi:hypothetical protein